MRRNTNCEGIRTLLQGVVIENDPTKVVPRFCAMDVLEFHLAADRWPLTVDEFGLSANFGPYAANKRTFPHAFVLQKQIILVRHASSYFEATNLRNIERARPTAENYQIPRCPCRHVSELISPFGCN